MAETSDILCLLPSSLAAGSSLKQVDLPLLNLNLRLIYKRERHQTNLRREVLHAMRNALRVKSKI